VAARRKRTEASPAQQLVAGPDATLRRPVGEASMRALPTLLVLLALAAAGPTQAGSTPEPGYEWIFSVYRSDGAGGFTGPTEELTGEQAGGVVEEGFELSGNGFEHLMVLGEGAENFWASAQAPSSNSEVADTIIGGRSELVVTRIFRKDASDATLSFTIQNSVLNVRDFRGDPARFLHAIVHHRLEAGAFFVFDEQALLDGAGGDWEFAEIGTGALPWEIVNGAVNSQGVVFGFSEPYEQEIDVSSVPDGSEFTVEYRVIADALDESSMKSLAKATGYDAIDPSTGISFEFTGLTPLPVPEAGAPLMLAAGAGLLAAARRARARR
jgi:hypothetical protein